MYDGEGAGSRRTAHYSKVPDADLRLCRCSAHVLAGFPAAGYGFA
jgi:hypothetical protein